MGLFLKRYKKMSTPRENSCTKFILEEDLLLGAEWSYKDVVKSIEIIIEGIQLMGPLGKTAGELRQRTLFSPLLPPFRPWWGFWRWGLQQHSG